MGLRVPAYEIRVGGDDLSETVRRHLREIRLASSSDQASDTLEIMVADADGRLTVPPAEREITVALGYADAGVVNMGIYYHTESDQELAPRSITIRATAADFRRRSTLKAPRRRAWDETSLGTLVSSIASEHGYTGVVHPSLAGVVIPHIDQTSESDLHLLRRMAKQYGAMLKAVAGRIVLAPRGRGRSAGTNQSLPVVRYAPGRRAAAEQNVLSARVTVRGRPRYGSVTAAWYDFEGAELQHVTAGSGGPVYQLREPFPDREQAEAAAAGRLDRLSRQEKELDMTVEGEPRLVSESVVELEGWPDDVSRWSVLRAEHTVSKASGYRTRITAEPVKGS